MALPRLLADTDFHNLGSIVVWSAVLIGLILMAFFAYSQFTRWMKSTDEPVSTGFSLSDLRELHRQGKMSNEEFELAKSRIVASAKRMTSQMPDVLGKPRGSAAAPAPKIPPMDTREDPQAPR